GHGHLQGRVVEVGVRRGGAPERRTSLWLPGVDAQVSPAGPAVQRAPLTAVRAG
ncbi:MAG: hypothetical protein AVDCRST_MAG48-1947, partial [uncultured Friedmanniella sp.]